MIIYLEWRNNIRTDPVGGIIQVLRSVASSGLHPQSPEGRVLGVGGGLKGFEFYVTSLPVSFWAHLLRDANNLPLGPWDNA